MTTPPSRGIVYAVGINKPGPGDTVKVKTGTPSVICACGSATPGRAAVQTVYAVVYPNVNKPPDQIPNTPAGVAGVVSTTPSGGSWSLPSVPAPACSAAPGSQNTLVVWVEYADGTYDHTYTYFLGVTSTQTECEASPTYCS